MSSIRTSHYFSQLSFIAPIFHAIVLLLSAKMQNHVCNDERIVNIAVTIDAYVNHNQPVGDQAKQHILDFKTAMESVFDILDNQIEYLQKIASKSHSIKLNLLLPLTTQRHFQQNFVALRKQFRATLLHAHETDARLKAFYSDFLMIVPTFINLYEQSQASSAGIRAALAAAQQEELNTPDSRVLFAYQNALRHEESHQGLTTSSKKLFRNGFFAGHRATMRSTAEHQLNTVMQDETQQTLAYLAIQNGSVVRQLVDTNDLMKKRLTQLTQPEQQAIKHMSAYLQQNNVLDATKCLAHLPFKVRITIGEYLPQPELLYNAMLNPLFRQTRKQGMPLSEKAKTLLTKMKACSHDTFISHIKRDIKQPEKWRIWFQLLTAARQLVLNSGSITDFEWLEYATLAVKTAILAVTRNPQVLTQLRQFELELSRQPILISEGSQHQRHEMMHALKQQEPHAVVSQIQAQLQQPQRIVHWLNIMFEARRILYLSGDKSDYELMLLIFLAFKTTMEIHGIQPTAWFPQHSQQAQQFTCCENDLSRGRFLIRNNPPTVLFAAPPHAIPTSVMASATPTPPSTPTMR